MVIAEGETTREPRPPGSLEAPDTSALGESVVLIDIGLVRGMEESRAELKC